MIFDLGGVVLGSPLHAIAAYERERAIAAGSVNRVVADSGAEGAWGRLERGLIGLSAFAPAFEAECAAAGFAIDARELMAQVVGESDVVITTAAIPGKQSPVLVTAEAVAGMQPGSVIVDLAAERGGNCALTKADERVAVHGVTILGPTNLPSEVPQHASQMFSANVTNFMLNLVKKGQIVLNLDDEIIRETLAAEGGQPVHSRVRDALGLPKLPEPAPLET